MRLKQLKISGFKSFANPITIDFDCDIAAIVGPNGCGKSNIVDAFRWVMGEQSARQLRGEKMPDILFSGTDTRKSLGMAEVSITLSAVDGALLTDYEEVTITRRLYRNSESEYLINKQTVRLKDIQDLLLGSGVGKNAFSVFEQGKLDQVIQLNPSERRVIFDEAAGIGRFLQRKKEALRKLEEVSENFNRVKDIHAEVDKQTKYLKKQSVQAKLYQENKERLKHLEQMLLHTKWHKAFERETETQNKLSSAEKGLQQTQETLQEMEKSLKAQRDRLFEKEKELKNKQKELNRLQTLLQVEKTEERQKKERLEDLQKREKALILEAENLFKRRKLSSESISAKRVHLEALSEEKKSLEQVFSQKQNERALFEKKVLELREEVKKHNAEYLRLYQELGKCQAELQEHKHRFDIQQKKRAELALAIQEKKKLSENIENESDEKRARVKALSSEIDHLKTQVQLKESALNEMHVLIENKKEEHAALSKTLSHARARENALNGLKEDLEGFSKGAKELLKESANKKSVLFGKIHPFFEHFSAKKGYEKALSAALHFYADTLVVRTKEDLEAVFAFVRAKKTSDFSIVCLESKPSGGKKAEPSLADFITVDAGFVHFLNPIEATDELIASGHFIDDKQVIFQVSAKNVFSREAELKFLKEEIEALSEKDLVFKNTITELVEERNQQEVQRRALQEERRKKEMLLVQENFMLQRALADLTKVKEELIFLQGEEQKSVQTTQNSHVLSDLENLIAKNEKELAQVKAGTAKKEEGLESQEKLLQKAILEERETQSFLRQKLESWRLLNQEIEIEKAKDEEWLRLETKFLQEKKSLEELVLQVTAHLSQAASKIQNCKEETEKAQEGVRLFEDELKDVKRTLFSLEKVALEEKSRLGRAEKEVHALEIALAKESSERMNFEKSLFEQHQFTSEKLEEKIEEIVQEEVAASIKELARTIEKTSAVNLMAIEEYKTQQERFSYLDKQLTDLTEAKHDLEGIIGKLEQESRKLFKETFEAIRSSFHKNFSLLFNGGEADLKFTESPDVLEAGIEIIAKPPGKQMRSISLLSGGEKCLTALALLFSIFEVRPAPFCILDEVDAPLDDSNVDRFTNVLRQFTPATQFLIVTHNKKTMAIADILIGVSMEEKGVSRLISLEFEKKTQGVSV